MTWPMTRTRSITWRVIRGMQRPWKSSGDVWECFGPKPGRPGIPPARIWIALRKATKQPFRPRVARLAAVCCAFLNPLGSCRRKHYLNITTGAGSSFAYRLLRKLPMQNSRNFKFDVPIPLVCAIFTALFYVFLTYRECQRAIFRKTL